MTGWTVPQPNSARQPGRAWGAFAVVLVTAGLLIEAGCQPLRLPVLGRDLAPQPPRGAASLPSPLPLQPVQAASTATRGDDVYTPVSNVDLHQAIVRDVAEIDQLLNLVNQGRPFPSAEILTIYEQGRNASAGDRVWSLRDFATSPVRSRDFPEEAGFYGSEAFLDEPVRAAITGTGSAAQFGPEQRRQAVQKGLLRILRYWSLQGLVAAGSKLRAGNIDPLAGAPHDVDAAWAIYVGPPLTDQAMSSLAGAARQMEGNFGRAGTIDQPLRAALARAQRAALRNDRVAFGEARREVIGRLNAIFYLESARDLTELTRAAQAGNLTGSANVQVAGLTAYLAIEPIVAIADPDADRAVMAVFRGDPAGLTMDHRDQALGALNRTAPALGLATGDIVSPSDFR